MRDLLSALPAPLPLLILLELPDIKALYAALLASPTLYFVFRQNASRVFRTVAARTIHEDIMSKSVSIYNVIDGLVEQTA